MTVYEVVISYNRINGNTPIYPSLVYRCCVSAADGKEARRNALFLAHAEGCKMCRVNIVRKMGADR